jgi:hypothetical protein
MRGFVGSQSPGRTSGPFKAVNRRRRRELHGAERSEAQEASGLATARAPRPDPHVFAALFAASHERPGDTGKPRSCILHGATA